VFFVFPSFVSPSLPESTKPSNLFRNAAVLSAFSSPVSP
jgi:hypothetical protein